MSAAGFLTPTLCRLSERLGQELTRVEQADGDDEAVHDLRVVLRRLRSLLKPARVIYGKFHTEAVRAALKQIADATGELRDEEVLRQTIAELPNDTTVVDGRERWLAAREQRDRLLGLLRDGHGARAHALLEALLLLPVDPDLDRPLEPFAARVVDRARHALRNHHTVALDDTEGLHELRILYKRLRYAAEGFAPALPPTLAALSKHAERFQKRLGEVHDLDVALVIVADDAGLDATTRTALREALTAARTRATERYAAERDEARVGQAPGSFPPSSWPKHGSRKSSPPPAMPTSSPSPPAPSSSPAPPSSEPRKEGG